MQDRLRQPARAAWSGRLLPTVFSYERVSSLHQARDGRGLERQSTDAAQWRKTHGFELDTNLDLTESGRSGIHGGNLADAALGRFLALVRAGECFVGRWIGTIKPSCFSLAGFV